MFDQNACANDSRAQFLNWAHMGRYADTTGNPALLADPTLPHPYTTKFGFGLNLEQELTRDLGASLRLGWNDGKTETWMFTDIDRTLAIGLDLKGARGIARMTRVPRKHHWL